MTICFRVPVATPMDLTVYNVLGQRVRTLARDAEAGDHVARWDGRDGSGQLTGTGLYLIRLRAGKRALVRKVMRLR